MLHMLDECNGFDLKTTLKGLLTLQATRCALAAGFGGHGCIQKVNVCTNRRNVFQSPVASHRRVNGNVISFAAKGKVIGILPKLFHLSELWKEKLPSKKHGQKSPSVGTPTNSCWVTQLV